MKKRVIGIGDNVCDKYYPSKIMYPGGQAMNFSVYAKKHSQTFDKKKALTFYSQSLILPWQCLGFIKFYHTAL